MRYTENEVKAAIAAGFYRDIDIGTPGRRKDELQDAKDRQTGSRNLEDDRYEFVAGALSSTMRRSAQRATSGSLSASISSTTGQMSLRALVRKWRR